MFKEKISMRRKLIIAGLTLSICLSACGKNGAERTVSENLTTVSTSDTAGVNEKATEDASVEEDVFKEDVSEEEMASLSDTSDDDDHEEGTIEKELAEIEQKDAGKKELLSRAKTQGDINRNTEDRYELWDDELTSIWNRLSDEKKEELEVDKNRWEKQLKANGVAARIEYLNGAMAVSEEISNKKNMTRKRVYELAAYLAEEKGESFEIPEKVKEDIESRDTKLDDVFKEFEGEWTITKNGDGDIVIKSLDASADGEAKWSFSYMGYEFTDLDVYGFSDNNIILFYNHREKEAPSYCWMHTDKDSDLIRVCRYSGFADFLETSSYFDESVIGERKK